MASFQPRSNLLPMLLLATASLASCIELHGAARMKTTHLHFYFHEFQTGPNATIMRVAGLPSSNASLGGFGDIFVFDSLLMEGTDASSMLIGRAQGLAVVSSMSGNLVLTTINFVFTAGEHNGSTFGVLGLFDASGGVADRPVVGGSGQFRLASGYALTTVLGITSGHLVAEFDVYLIQ